ncbi:MAG TPA: TetR/AcrR family transcriptional regulator [Spirochaetia bacterium]|jgi:AcrR family transcriptional regulator|nr:TetR/AcrR family transcriptional regulator [Spirochaetia bacterium]
MKRDEKTKVLLDAALKVFRCKGYHGATTKEIADAAGIPVGTMFRIFPNKEEMLLALVSDLVDTVAPQLFAESMEKVLLGYLGQGMDATIKAFIHSRLVLFHENRALISVIHAESAFNPRLKEVMFSRIYSPMKSIIEKFIAAGVAKGLFRPVDPPAAARYIGSAVLYTFLDVWYQDTELTGETLETIENQFVDLILNGIKA